METFIYKPTQILIQSNSFKPNLFGGVFISLAATFDKNVVMVTPPVEKGQ